MWRFPDGFLTALRPQPELDHAADGVRSGIGRAHASLSNYPDHQAGRAADERRQACADPWPARPRLETTQAVTANGRGLRSAPQSCEQRPQRSAATAPSVTQDHSDRRPQPGINWPVNLSLTMPMQAWRRSRRHRRSSRQSQEEAPFGRGALYYVLSNHFYIGEVKYKNHSPIYPDRHAMEHHCERTSFINS